MLTLHVPLKDKEGETQGQEHGGGGGGSERGKWASDGKSSRGRQLATWLKLSDAVGNRAFSSVGRSENQSQKSRSKSTLPRNENAPQWKIPGKPQAKGVTQYGHNYNAYKFLWDTGQVHTPKHIFMPRAPQESK